MKTKLAMTLMLLGTLAMAEDTTARSGATPVYPWSQVNPQALEIANVLLRNADAIQKELTAEALWNKVTILNGAVQQRAPLGKDHKVFVFTLQQCWTQPGPRCEQVGSLTIKQSLFQAAGGEVRTYTVELD